MRERPLSVIACQKAGRRHALHSKRFRVNGITYVDTCMRERTQSMTLWSIEGPAGGYECDHRHVDSWVDF